MSADTLIARLAAAPVDSSDWLAVADAVFDDHRAAAIALELALRKSSGDLSLEAEIWSRILAVARADLDQSAIANARKKLAVVAHSDAMVRFGLVRQLANEGDAESVRAVCKGPFDAFDARIAWPCIEGDPEGLIYYLAGLAKLPVLTYVDAERLARLDRRHRLYGLDCLYQDDVDPYAVLPPFWRRASVYDRVPAPEVVEIYYRFHDGAPPRVAQCFLARAAQACLALTEHGGQCPMPYAMSDYVATLTPNDRMRYLALLFDEDSKAISSWLSGSPQAATIVLNLHIMLANLLLNERAQAVYWLTPYHVSAAAEMWPRFGNPKIPFAAMFSPDVLGGICRDRERFCTSACSQPGPSWQTCSAECNVLTERAARAVCP